MSEEMWHVQIEPGEVKTLTLEQMDDMYRLELISGSTLVWQRGMPKALPLSVVAGIEEEEEEIMEIEPEPVYAPPPPSSRAAPPQQTITPPPASTAVLAAPAAPPMPKADFYSPASLQPITMSETPYYAGDRSSGLGGRIVMGVAIAAGVLLTLHRNDLLRPMAESAGKGAAYDNIEKALGSPSFGTTRAVTQFSSMLNPPADTATEATVTAAAAIPSSPSVAETDSADAPEQRDTEETKDAKNKADSKAAKRPARAPAAQRPRRAAPKAADKKLKSFKGSEYDPMNARL